MVGGMVGRYRLSARRNGELVGCVILEIPIRIVFDNQDVILMTERIYLLSSLQRQKTGCRVLTHPTIASELSPSEQACILTLPCTSNVASCPCSYPNS